MTKCVPQACVERHKRPPASAATTKNLCILSRVTACLSLDLLPL